MIRYFLFLVLFFATVLFPSLSLALTPSFPNAFFSLSSPASNYSIGETIPVELKLHQSGRTITSLKSYIEYDASKLYLSSIEVQNSDFPYWWENSYTMGIPNGQVRLQASAPVSQSVKPIASVAKLNFKAIRQGSAALIYNSGSIALNEEGQNVLDLTQSQGAVMSISNSSFTFSGSFLRDLKQGNEGADVKALQQFLNAKGFVLASSGAGSSGNETEYFGPRTHAAVMRFQDANAAQILAPLGVDKGTGFFGPSTRGYINSLR